MKHFLTILAHEVRMLLVSPSTYIAAVAFLALMGFMFTGILEKYSKAPQDLSPASAFFESISCPVIFMVPLLTMKCLAEERRLGTIETLLTTPVTTTEVVLGKYGAAYLLYLLFWASTAGALLHPQAVRGRRPADRPGPHPRRLPLHRGLRAPLHRDRRLRELALPQPGRRGHPLHTMLVGMIFGGQYLANASWLDREALSPIKDAVHYAQIQQHYQDFTRGVVDMRELLFYVSGSVLALIFSILSVETKLLHS
jgi:ABC-2 type transport system permease protein